MKTKISTTSSGLLGFKLGVAFGILALCSVRRELYMSEDFVLVIFSLMYSLRTSHISLLRCCAFSSQSLSTSALCSF